MRNKKRVFTINHCGLIFLMPVFFTAFFVANRLFPAAPNDACDDFKVVDGDLESANTILFGEVHTMSDKTIACISLLTSTLPAFQSNHKILIEGAAGKLKLTDLSENGYGDVCYKQDQCIGWDNDEQALKKRKELDRLSPGLEAMYPDTKTFENEYMRYLSSIDTKRNQALINTIESQAVPTIVIAGLTHLFRSNYLLKEITDNVVQYDFNKTSTLVRNALHKRRHVNPYATLIHNNQVTAIADDDLIFKDVKTCSKI